MKRKHVIITLFLCAVVFSLAVVLNTWTQDELSKEETRFDLDQNDELSDAEKQLMFRVMRLEAARGTKFSAQQIREMLSGQRDRSRRRGGFGGRRGSREPSGPRLDPEQVAFKDGAATVPDRETFEKLSYQGTDVRIDTQLTGIEFVKFQIENTHTQNPQLYFMNTETHRSHGSFMSAAGLGRGQGQMRGVLSYRPLFMAPNGEPGVYTFEFNPNDAFPFEEIKLAHDLLVAKMPVLKNRLGYMIPIHITQTKDTYPSRLNKCLQVSGISVHLKHANSIALTTSLRLWGYLSIPISQTNWRMGLL